MTAFGELASEEQQRLEEAAAWRLRLAQEPAARGSSQYLDWCADPRNAKARDAVERAWTTVRILDSTPEMLELRRQALNRLRRPEPSRWRTRGVKMAAVAAAVVVLGVTGAVAVYYYRCWVSRSSNSTVCQTQIGERRIVALPDGSRISMDSATTVHVTYSNTARAITLDSGRSRFDVAHDPNRPFTVAAGQQTVLALGTSFDVERLQSSVVITLVQGQVLIEGPQSETSHVADSGIALKAGDQLVAAKNLRPAILATDVQAARAWEAGRLLFRDEPLGDAVARVNRYIEHPIEIDPSITSVRVSGVFNAGDINSFVSAVTSYFPIDAITSVTHGIRLKPRS